MQFTTLWLARHGESVANVAATAAENACLETIDVDFRDADVPLSALGERQADALGSWLREAGAPAAVWSSPYLRARQTATRAIDRAGLDAQVLVDERLRDRELGILDLLTSHGVEARYPGEAGRRRWLGKYYYRPPGGESWADVSLRLRSVLNEGRERADGPLLVVAHDAIVILLLAVLTGMTEQEILDFARVNTVANASVTTLVLHDGVWRVERFSSVEHLAELDVPITEHPGDDDVQPQ